VTATPINAAVSQWPPGGLERVANCPVCDGESRELLHGGLTDRVFLVAPGEWKLWRCHACQSAFLDPRPSQAAIGIAYQQYYTHQDVDLPKAQTAFQRLRMGLGNDYRNRRYGTHLTPALPLGWLIARLLPPLAGAIDVAYRYLPKVRKGQSKCVLDIGCGNGAFLKAARNAGWQVAGVEPDPDARRQALDHGLEVRQSTSDWLTQPASFDYVTLSHVIEHVHDPIALLRDCFALLRPGGGLFIDTPNINSVGYGIYRRDWVHLDPPRHLMLFSRSSLADAVAQAGFRNLKFYRRPDAFRHSAMASRRMIAGADPFSNKPVSGMPSRPGFLVRARAMLAQQKAEFLTLTAAKPAQ
jgi:2-polyprenyl-3-methyl-5-hydroxy-6-metoxy-1,4-benzoquinol methylase